MKNKILVAVLFGGIGMTNEPVIIKGTKEGITIVVEENSNFEDVKKVIYEKLQNSGNFFAGAKVFVKAKNGNLKEDEFNKLQEILTNFGMSLQEAQSPKTLIFPKPNRSRVLILKKTIRSGQKISYRGTVVILGDANPGSEIVATGDILVLGTLRGMAHAGAAGDTTAIVAAYRLRPTQLRIADVISRPPEDKEESPPFPEVARLKDNIIVIEPYNALK